MFPPVPEGSVPDLPSAPIVRPKDKSKVEALMKRRYSVRAAAPPKLERFPPELSTKAKPTQSDKVTHLICEAHGRKSVNQEWIAPSWEVVDSIPSSS